MSEIFDRIHNTASTVAKITKNNARLSSISVALDKKYTLLGKIVYGTENGSQAQISSEIEELIKERDSLRDEIEKMLKIKRCPNCGAEIPDKNHYSIHFCNNCGAKLPDEPVDTAETKNDGNEQCVCSEGKDDQPDEGEAKNVDTPCECQKENECIEKKEKKSPSVKTCKFEDLPKFLDEIEKENKRRFEETGVAFSHHKIEIAHDGTVTITEM